MRQECGWLKFGRLGVPVLTDLGKKVQRYPFSRAGFSTRDFPFDALTWFRFETRLTTALLWRFVRSA